MSQTRKMRNLLLTIGCFVLLLVAFSKGGQAFGKEPAKPVLPSADCFAAASEAYGQAYATMEVRDLVSRADVFKSLGQTDSAIFYYARGYNRFRNDLPDKERYWCAIATLRLADVYYYAANYSLSLELYIKGLKMIEGCTRRDHIAEFYIGLGNVYWLFEDLENAGVCYENGYALSVELGDTMSQRRLANHLVAAVAWLIYHQRCKFRFLYKKLYTLNNELTDALEQSRARQPKPEEPLRETVETVAVEKEQQEEVKEEADVQPSDSGADDVRATQLLPEVREKLLADIAGVMENTLEFCNAEFSLKRLATLVNSNSTYVSRAINEKYHKNFSSFLNSYRVREVCKRLKDQEHYENYTIRAIAESVGYKSQTTFIKAFKEETGMSPSVYQKIAKTEISK